MTTTAHPPGTGGTGSEQSGAEMSLVEHLQELRTRLFKAALAVVGGFALGFVFRFPVLNILKRPYCALPSELRAGTTNAFDADSCRLIFTDPLGAFVISLKAAAVVAVLVAAPVICYQIWRFVTPGLEPVERKYALPFVVASGLLFAAGALFSYVVIPRGLEFLLGFAGEGIVSLMDANEYMNFMLVVMISFGLAFNFPLVLIMLSLMDVITADQLRKYRRHAIFGVFVAAAIITPTQDPFTLTLMAAPLIAFYEVTIFIARRIERRRARRLQAA